MSDIFIINNLTDFEKLLFSQAHVKELKTENSKLSITLGKLQSELDELKDTDKLLDEVLRLRHKVHSLTKLKNQLKKDNGNLLINLCKYKQAI